MDAPPCKCGEAATKHACPREVAEISSKLETVQKDLEYQIADKDMILDQKRIVENERDDALLKLDSAQASVEIQRNEVIRQEKELDALDAKLEAMTKAHEEIFGELQRAELQVREVTNDRDRLKKCLEEIWLGLDEFFGSIKGVIPDVSLDLWREACRKMRAYADQPVKGSPSGAVDMKAEVDELKAGLNKIADFANTHAPSDKRFLDILCMATMTLKPWQEK